MEAIDRCWESRQIGIFGKNASRNYSCDLIAGDIDELQLRRSRGIEDSINTTNDDIIEHLKVLQCWRMTYVAW